MNLKHLIASFIYIVLFPEIVGTQTIKKLNTDEIDFCIAYKGQMTCLPFEVIGDFLSRIGNMIPGIEHIGILVFSGYALFQIKAKKHKFEQGSDDQSSQ